MFWVGAAGVPLMFPVAAMYFWSEARDPTASKVIRGYIFKGAALFVIYTVVLIAWFTTFQVFKNGALSGFSVLDENKTTSVLSTLAN
ncbi:hypothetical protein BU14_0072s0048 [Porphyra umbilicalis]|uniref:Uncharacterized protein n=1 Tax=Porphyra umbilicalis TaxID=2786 RepID=A0A1X6PFS3_PORUM|nr:hypothetical protein BU14_0072s0048 [Porphyra umbilicalis]|eukprot:OSX79690.1 hypothetical protein BU14_0072s0048 [Porphyra umbilicalis]